MRLSGRQGLAIIARDFGWCGKITSFLVCVFQQILWWDRFLGSTKVQFPTILTNI